MIPALEAAGLHILGGLHEGGNTLLLVGPDGPAFWPILQASPEFKDGTPSPIDRYSTRILNAIEGAEAVFPFGGPPHQPFVHWALATGRCFASPVQFLVHAELGLFTSFRGTLRLKGHHPLPPPLPNPCESCVEKPCLEACPVGAIEKASVFDFKLKLSPIRDFL